MMYSLTISVTRPTRHAIGCSVIHCLVHPQSKLATPPPQAITDHAFVDLGYRIFVISRDQETAGYPGLVYSKSYYAVPSIHVHLLFRYQWRI